MRSFIHSTDGRSDSAAVASRVNAAIGNNAVVSDASPQIICEWNHNVVNSGRGINDLAGGNDLYSSLYSLAERKAAKQDIQYAESFAKPWRELDGISVLKAVANETYAPKMHSNPWRLPLQKFYPAVDDKDGLKIWSSPKPSYKVTAGSVLTSPWIPAKNIDVPAPRGGGSEYNREAQGMWINDSGTSGWLLFTDPLPKVWREPDKKVGVLDEGALNGSTKTLKVANYVINEFSKDRPISFYTQLPISTSLTKNNKRTLYFAAWNHHLFKKGLTISYGTTWSSKIKENPKLVKINGYKFIQVIVKDAVPYGATTLKKNARFEVHFPGAIAISLTNMAPPTLGGRKANTMAFSKTVTCAPVHVSKAITSVAVNNELAYWAGRGGMSIEYSRNISVTNTIVVPPKNFTLNFVGRTLTATTGSQMNNRWMMQIGDPGVLKDRQNVTIVGGTWNCNGATGKTRAGIRFSNFTNGCVVFATINAFSNDSGVAIDGCKNIRVVGCTISTAVSGQTSSAVEIRNHANELDYDACDTIQINGNTLASTYGVTSTVLQDSLIASHKNIKINNNNITAAHTGILLSDVDQYAIMANTIVIGSGLVGINVTTSRTNSMWGYIWGNSLQGSSAASHISLTGLNSNLMVSRVILLNNTGTTNTKLKLNYAAIVSAWQDDASPQIFVENNNTSQIYTDKNATYHMLPYAQPMVQYYQGAVEVTKIRQIGKKLEVWLENDLAGLKVGDYVSFDNIHPAVDGSKKVLQISHDPDGVLGKLTKLVVASGMSQTVCLAGTLSNPKPYPIDPDDNTGYAHKDKSITANKIVAKFDTTYGTPYSFVVQVKNRGSWSTIYTHTGALSSETEPDYNGSDYNNNFGLAIYNNNGTWTTTPSHFHPKDNPNALTFDAVRLIIDRMTDDGAYATLTELSARFSADLTDYTESFDVSKELGDSSKVAPVGRSSTNTGSVSLINDTGLFDINNVSSPFYGMFVKNAVVHLYMNYTTGTGTQFAVKQKALTSNVAALTTSVAHNLTTGDQIFVQGVGTAFDGAFRVASTPNSTTIMYGSTASDVPYSAATGFVNKNTFNAESFVTKVKLGTMLVGGWKSAGRESAGIDLIDKSGVLQNMKCRDFVHYDMTENGKAIPMETALQALLDSLGFGNYVFKTKNDLIPIDFIWSKKDDTPWQILQDIAEANQMSMYFDEIGRLQIISPGYIYAEEQKLLGFYTSPTTITMNYASNIEGLTVGTEVYGEYISYPSYISAIDKTNKILTLITSHPSGLPVDASSASLWNTAATAKNIGFGRRVDYQIMGSNINNDRIVDRSEIKTFRRSRAINAWTNQTLPTTSNIDEDLLERKPMCTLVKQQAEFYVNTYQSVNNSGTYNVTLGVFPAQDDQGSPPTTNDKIYVSNIASQFNGLYTLTTGTATYGDGYLMYYNGPGGSVTNSNDAAGTLGWSSTDFGYEVTNLHIGRKYTFRGKLYIPSSNTATYTVNPTTDATITKSTASNITLRDAWVDFQVDFIASKSTHQLKYAVANGTDSDSLYIYDDEAFYADDTMPETKYDEVINADLANMDRASKVTVKYKALQQYGEKATARNKDVGKNTDLYSIQNDALSILEFLGFKNGRFMYNPKYMNETQKITDIGGKAGSENEKSDPIGPIKNLSGSFEFDGTVYEYVGLYAKAHVTGGYVAKEVLLKNADDLARLREANNNVAPLFTGEGQLKSGASMQIWNVQDQYEGIKNTIIQPKNISFAPIPPGKNLLPDKDGEAAYYKSKIKKEYNHCGCAFVVNSLPKSSIGLWKPITLGAYFTLDQSYNFGIVFNEKNQMSVYATSSYNTIPDGAPGAKVKAKGLVTPMTVVWKSDLKGLTREWFLTRQHRLEVLIYAVNWVERRFELYLNRQLIAVFADTKTVAKIRYDPGITVATGPYTGITVPAIYAIASEGARPKWYDPAQGLEEAMNYKADQIRAVWKSQQKKLKLTDAQLEAKINQSIIANRGKVIKDTPDQSLKDYLTIQTRDYKATVDRKDFK